MDQPPTQPEASPKVVYPSPPDVHWAMLLAAWVVFAILIMICTPKDDWDFLSSLAVDVWALFICLWIRKLDPRSMSIYWCGAYVAVQLAGSVPSAPQTFSMGLEIVSVASGLLRLVLWIVTIYVVRAELLKHYKEREPIGLQLGGIMTFFFSFLYFQSRLYPLVQFKKHQELSSVNNPGRAPLP
ncbi:MAG: hypothetical protein ABSA48_04780 [Terracidiphilus sp.]|jgi:hypothetical protein